MVPSDTPSCVASSLVLSPLAAARATCHCRRVSVPGSLVEAAPADLSAAAWCSRPSRRLPLNASLTQHDVRAVPDHRAYDLAAVAAMRQHAELRFSAEQRVRSVRRIGLVLADDQPIALARLPDRVRLSARSPRCPAAGAGRRSCQRPLGAAGRGRLLAHRSRPRLVLSARGRNACRRADRHVTPEDRARVLRAGFQYHIAKPVDPERLIGVVSILALKV
jgi:hypothetical protein